MTDEEKKEILRAEYSKNGAKSWKKRVENWGGPEKAKEKMKEFSHSFHKKKKVLTKG